MQRSLAHQMKVLKDALIHGRDHVHTDDIKVMLEERKAVAEKLQEIGK